MLGRGYGSVVEHLSAAQDVPQFNYGCPFLNTCMSVSTKAAPLGDHFFSDVRHHCLGSDCQQHRSMMQPESSISACQFNVRIDNHLELLSFVPRLNQSDTSLSFSHPSVSFLCTFQIHFAFSICRLCGVKATAQMTNSICSKFTH